MHENPSVKYEASYKIRGKPWEKGILAYPIVGWRILCFCEWLRAIVEFGEVEDFREGTLEPRSAHLYQLAQFLHCTTPLQLEGPWGRRVPKE